MARREFTIKELKAETWKAVPNYEGLYEVSDLGRVRSVRNQGPSFFGRILKPAIQPYKKVLLCKKGKVKCASVHRLVAEAFIGPRPLGMTVNHKDAIKTNNRVSNLEYVTHTENIRHAKSLGLMRAGESSPLAKLTKRDVRKIIKLLDCKMSLKYIAKLMNVTESAIRDIDIKKHWLSLPEVRNRTTRATSFRTKLTEAQVREIKRRLNISREIAPLAREFNVHIGTICDIKKERTWAWVKI